MDIREPHAYRIGIVALSRASLRKAGDDRHQRCFHAREGVTHVVFVEMGQCAH